MNIEREIRSLIKDLEECDQPYEEIFDQIVRLVNERVGELLQEIDRLREENEGRKEIIEAYMRIEHDLAEDAERYLQQRDKLIEGLKLMASSPDEFYVVVGGREIPQGHYAKQLLKEIGVKVDA